LLQELYQIARKCQTEITFNLPSDISDLPPLYHRDGKPYVYEPLPPVVEVVPVRQVLPTHVIKMEPQVSDSSTASKRSRDDSDDSDEGVISKRQKINNIDAKIVVSKLESQLATALLEIQKLKELLNV
jgi:hypothetical protein